ncbi:hypothetical protein H5410_015176 [Solanum commersonii]|uniref:Uncharacterized protein n=1 Tax=Solanum commersonii TaxID=4109 RepID=A0A9J5ZT41_SOLCO|nr:hypothetical protein H5410_015176 [Solanum commersonii]
MEDLNGDYFALLVYGSFDVSRKKKMGYHTLPPHGQVKTTTPPTIVVAFTSRPVARGEGELLGKFWHGYCLTTTTPPTTRGPHHEPSWGHDAIFNGKRDMINMQRAYPVSSSELYIASKGSISFALS